MRLPALLLALFFIFSHLNAAETKVVTGVVLLNDLKSPDFKKITQTLSAKWGAKVDSLSITDKTALFVANGATITMAFFNYPDKSDDIIASSGISWLWKNAEQVALTHKGQLVISIIGDDRRALEMYMTFTRCAAAVLENTNSSGVFMNSQYLLLEKGYYLSAANNLNKQQALPLYCWVYFGIMEKDDMHGGYTYGMTEFCGVEMEINSKDATVSDLHNLLYAAALKAVESRKPWRNGDVYTTNAGDKLTLKTAKGIYLDQQVLQIGL